MSFYSGFAKLSGATAAVLVVAGSVGAGTALAGDGADWLPLRGSSIKVGCTWNPSSCGGYHYSSAKAIDFLVRPGSPVFASGKGKIFEAKGGCGVRSDGCNRDRGNFITIKHKSRYSRYLHLSKIVVKKGRVSAGQLIGYSGNSGQDEADHLHYDELAGDGRTKLAPGTLYACHGTKKKGYGRWASVAYEDTIRNDGYEFGCATGAISIFARANRRYVSAEAAYPGDTYGMLRARSTLVRGWERFQIVGNCRGGKGCAIRSLANGLYVSAERNYGGTAKGMLRARAGAIGTWERFRLKGDCRTGCALKASANKRYVAAEKEDPGSRKGMLRARSKSIGTWEKFKFKPSKP